MQNMPLPINKFFWVCCAVYLLYLAGISQTIMYYDAIGYHYLAQVLQHQGWTAYWSSGPNREPLYPWFVSLILRLAEGLRMDYVPVLLVAQVFVFLSMLWLLEKLLQRMGVETGYRLTVLFYAVFSPAFIYTVFTEWSEIVTYPLILIIIGVCIKAWMFICGASQNKLKALGWGAVLGMAVLSLTAVKAVMEPVAMFLIFPWAYAVFQHWHKARQKSFLALLIILGFSAVYWTGINVYKWENWYHNGQFVLTDRGSWALYGNVARRMAPLTQRQWEAAVLSVPTNGPECQRFLKPPNECQYWTFTPSDEWGHKAVGELSRQGLSSPQINTALIRMSFQKMFANPLQAIALMFMEGMKFMFWEYNAWPEFAVYPSWLRHLYENGAFYAFLHYGMALLTFVSLVHALVFLVQNRKNIFLPHEDGFKLTIGIFFTSLFIVLYIFFYSFFYCSGRYAMPLAPLYLILIAFFFKKVYAQIIRPA